MNRNCPECGDNHIKMLVVTLEDGSIHYAEARCSNGHSWTPPNELNSDSENAKLELPTRSNDE